MRISDWSSDVCSSDLGIKYLVLGAFSSAFFLYGIALVYGGTGSTNLVRIAELFATSVLSNNGLVLAGLALLLVGFGFKVALVPFHSWSPDVYQGAPSPSVFWMRSEESHVWIEYVSTCVSRWSPTH